jgi:sn-glycerol 3-phosphate transport system ATP-binding protein
MRVEIRKLQRRLKTTSIYVTHDQLEAMTLADSLVVMNGGRVEQIGKPIDLYRKPLTTFVASFIGAPPMNLFPVERIGKVGLNGLPANAGIVGVRPEDLLLGTGAANGGLGLDLTVDAIERIGAETFVYGSNSDAGEVMVRVPGDDAPPLGSVVHAAAVRGKLHIFSGDGSARLEL